MIFLDLVEICSMCFEKVHTSTSTRLDKHPEIEQSFTSGITKAELKIILILYCLKSESRKVGCAKVLTVFYFHQSFNEI